MQRTTPTLFQVAGKTLGQRAVGSSSTGSAAATVRQIHSTARSPRSLVAARAGARPSVQRRGRIAPASSRASSSSSSAAASQATVIPDIADRDTYDIVIIGGSNAGLAFACALLAQPTILKTTRILLIEGSSLDKTRGWSGQGEWENRVSSLTAENVAWLESIGVWKHIEQSRSCPVHEMVIWANPSPESTPTIHFPPLDHPMARMTENLNLQRALLRRIEEVGGEALTIKENSRVGEMQLGEGGRWVGLQIGEEWVRGSLVVGADGPNSPVRHFSQIESYGHAYQTHAVVATLNHPPSPLYPNTTAFQRFLPTGPLAFLPLSSEASTMVWSTLPSHAAALKRLSPEALTTMINAGYTLPESTLKLLTDQMLRADSANTPLTAEALVALLQTLPSPPLSTDQPLLPPTVSSVEPRSVASFPLRLSHAEEYLGARTALLGDAAHTIHPLAGQGLNMGLADVRSLARTLEHARQRGGDLGSLTALADYPRERYPANHLMLSTTDKLHYIFRNRNGAVNWLRGTGLDVINELTPLKKLLMGGAGSDITSSSHGRARGREREFGRNHAADQNEVKAQGWPAIAASGVEGWFALKSVGSMAGSVLGEVAKNGLRRAADILERK